MSCLVAGAWSSVEAMEGDGSIPCTSSATRAAPRDEKLYNAAVNGRFIVIEGPDGAGTTTHGGLLAERLRAGGKEVLLTAEPTDGPIGRSIREYLKGKDRLPASALQLLFCADRAWHMQSVIEPALREGKIVICDRYSASTLVYGAVGGVDRAWLRSINEHFPQPDCQLLLLPSLDVAMARLERRADKDLFETRKQQEQIHAEYRRWAEENPSVTVIDASGAKDAVAAEILEAADIG